MEVGHLELIMAPHNMEEVQEHTVDLLEEIMDMVEVLLELIQDHQVLIMDLQLKEAHLETKEHKDRILVIKMFMDSLQSFNLDITQTHLPNLFQRIFLLQTIKMERQLIHLQWILEQDL